MMQTKDKNLFSRSHFLRSVGIIIIPGHGPVGNRHQLIEYRDMLVNVQENVSKLKRLAGHFKKPLLLSPQQPMTKNRVSELLTGKLLQCLCMQMYN